MGGRAGADGGAGRRRGVGGGSGCLAYPARAPPYQAAPANQRSELCEALYFWAELLVRPQELGRALSLAERARAVATDVGRDGYQLAATILAIPLRLACSQIDVAAAIDELERLLPVWPRDDQQAALHYELWRLDPTHAADRRTATDRVVGSLHSTARRMSVHPGASFASAIAS